MNDHDGRINMPYEMKPVVWNREEITEDDPELKEVYVARTPMCKLQVRKGFFSDNGEEWCDYHWTFSEFRDDGGGFCESIEDGKFKCEQVWKDRLKECLYDINPYAEIRG